jgi:Family of unknown function (DUF6035)
VGKGEPHRTLKRAVRLSDMGVITSDELLKLDSDSYQEIRRTVTRARNEGTSAFVCDECGFPIYAPREPTTKLPFWRHHKGAPKICPWWTGDPGSTDDISASQFKGAQESPLHHRLKNTVAELLRLDQLTETDSVVIDEYVAFGAERRRPDVRAVYDGRPIAIEIQLATTQIPIIVAREDFYNKEGRHLIWLTWNFAPVERAHLLTAFEDIFYSHNKNLFSLDDGVIAASRAANKFLIRAFWEHGSGWGSKVTDLQELQWPESGLPFAIAPPPPWHLQFRQSWLDATSTTGTHWLARREHLAELAIRLNIDGLDVAALEEADFESLLNVVLSFVAGRPIGSAQSNLIEVINTFLSVTRRARYARILRKVILVTVGDDILQRKSVAEKFVTADDKEQDGPNSFMGKAALLLFPELFQVRKGKP